MARSKLLASLAVAGFITATVLASAAPASANSNTQTKAYSGGKLTAYVYIQNVSDANNCGSFSTRASATTRLSYITNNVDWDPIGIGASASVKGVGVSVSGNNGSSPSASNHEQQRDLGRHLGHRLRIVEHDLPRCLLHRGDEGGRDALRGLGSRLVIVRTKRTARIARAVLASSLILVLAGCDAPGDEVITVDEAQQRLQYGAGRRLPRPAR